MTEPGAARDWWLGANFRAAYFLVVPLCAYWLLLSLLFHLPSAAWSLWWLAMGGVGRCGLGVCRPGSCDADRLPPPVAGEAPPPRRRRRRFGGGLPRVAVPPSPRGDRRPPPLSSPAVTPVRLGDGRCGVCGWRPAAGGHTRVGAAPSVVGGAVATVTRRWKGGGGRPRRRWRRRRRARPSVTADLPDRRQHPRESGVSRRRW